MFHCGLGLLVVSLFVTLLLIVNRVIGFTCCSFMLSSFLKQDARSSKLNRLWGLALDMLGD